MKRDPMLYIHIPFCVRKCQYCDFLSFPAPCGSAVSDYLEALEKEIFSYKQNALIKISSIFIGGGTPSLLSPEQFENMMESVYQVFSLQEQGEFTIESNPGTITEEKALAWKKTGVNRVSMGVQSLDDTLLKTLGRIHSVNEVRESYEILRKAGFSNVSFDLMSALPGQSMQQWMETLKEAVHMGPEHFSCYSLILEEGTPFYEQQEMYTFPDEDEDREMYRRMVAFLKENGYERYEISNFAKRGKESRHNTGYWRRVPYYGLGLGASGMTQENVRIRNTDDMAQYLKYSGDTKMRVSEEEAVDEKGQMEEFMFLGLRCQKGISENEFEETFHRSLASVYGEVLEKRSRDGLLIYKDGWWHLSDLGIDLSNQVFVDFLMDR